MQRVIKGTRYNSGTAKIIGSAGDVTLYRSKTGNYFTCDENTITPMDKATANEWAVKHLGSELTDDIAKTNISIIISLDLLAKLDNAAQKNYCRSDIVRLALEAYLK